MAWLDRDRTPVRFTVTTSVASGLAVAAVVRLAGADLPYRELLPWVAVAAGGAATGLVMALARSQARRSPARAFFITSAFMKKYHVAAFVRRLHSALDRDGVDLVLKVPDRDYDAGAQAHHLRRVLDRRREYIGGVIFATEMRRLRDDLVEFCAKVRLPVVFTDIEPFPEDGYPENTAYIGYDTGELGELAGRWLAAKLRGRERPRVLIVASQEHSDRQKRCKEILHDELPGVDVTVVDQCAFDRSRAYEAVLHHLHRLPDGRPLDAIFCTNDEMALGAVDALSATATDCPVIGVDGVDEARALIDAGTSPLRATVIQDTHRLATGIVDVLLKMHRRRPVCRRTILRAEIYERSRPTA